MCSFLRSMWIRNCWRMLRGVVRPFSLDSIYTILTYEFRGYKSSEAVAYGEQTIDSLALVYRGIPSMREILFFIAYPFSKIDGFQQYNIMYSLFPYFHGPICTRCDQLSCLRWMVFNPCYHLLVYLRRWIGLQWLSLCHPRQRMCRQCGGDQKLTSNRSQAQTLPSSSPNITLASWCPKLARQRYWLCT